MKRDPNRNPGKPGDVVGDILHDVGDELAAVVSVPGEITYHTFNKFFEFIGEFSLLLGRTLKFIAKGAVDVRDTLNQMAYIGVASLPIVLITVAFSGAVLSLYMSQLVVKWGIGSYTGGVVGVSITREIGPVLTAVVMAARSGSAIAAELGSMKVTEQIDALRALAVSPVRYLVVPRLLAGVVMLPALTAIADLVGTTGGYIVAVMNGVAGGGFLSTLKTQVVPYDVFMGMLKTVFFAVVIVVVGAQQGLRTSGGATGVGKSTTSSVVISIVVIYILNFFLAYVMFGGRTASL
ncbi:MAG: ABC transporter permease [Armatimonadetes bacterium]|nr:ABC transporter permease [Armatimonadota bacterium]